jgi:hypothetical protein
MALFMLLLHESPTDLADVSPDEIQRIIGEYTAWRERLEAEGRLVGGRKLKDEGGREMRRIDGENRVVDGPYAEAKEVLGGYFEIEAADYDEAVVIAHDCPHLAYGGRIALRRIDLIND